MIKLYYLDLSPVCRSVDMLIHMLNIPKLEYINVDLLAKEHMKPDFLNLNPAHTIPVLDDDGFIMWESQAICAYLASKYGKDDSLYPKDLKKRAKVDEQLHYGNEFFCLFKLISLRITVEKTKMTDEERTKIANVHDIFEKILQDQDYFAGTHLTIADFSFLSLIPTSIEVYSPIPKDKYPRLNAWLERCRKAVPKYEEVNGKGSEGLNNILKDILNNA